MPPQIVEPAAESQQTKSEILPDVCAVCIIAAATLGLAFRKFERARLSTLKGTGDYHNTKGKSMKKLSAIAAIASLFALFAFTNQAAADGHSVSADPMSVSEAGTHTITVSGANWPAEGTVILACPGYEGVEPEVMGETDALTMCDLGNLMPVMVDGDGSFSESVDLDIPESGLVILVGNQAAGLGETLAISVGDMSMDDEMMDDEMMHDDEMMDDEMMHDDEMMDDEMMDDEMMHDDEMDDEMMHDDEMMDDEMMHEDDMMPMGGVGAGFGGTAGGGSNATLALAAGLLAVAVLGGAAIALRRND